MESGSGVADGDAHKLDASPISSIGAEERVGLIVLLVRYLDRVSRGPCKS